MFHELGHFLLAKANGVAVMEFSIGMGPRLASVVWRGTRYSLKILPLGGSCAMADEDTDSGDPNGFLSKSVWARISVIAAQESASLWPGRCLILFWRLFLV